MYNSNTEFEIQTKKKKNAKYGFIQSSPSLWYIEKVQILLKMSLAVMRASVFKILLRLQIRTKKKM